MPISNPNQIFSSGLMVLLLSSALLAASSKLVLAQTQQANSTSPTLSPNATQANATLVAPVKQPVQTGNETIQTNASGQIHQHPNMSGMMELPSESANAIRGIIDLSHPLDNDTLHWPKNSGFEYHTDIDGERKDDKNEPYYIKSDKFTMAIHTGTHLDAPRHFSKNGWTVEQIPLERLIDVPAHVIDLSSKVTNNRSYNFVKADFTDPSTNKPLVSQKSVVLVYTGLSKLYKEGKKAYLGTDSNNISQMEIPGFSKEAADFMVEMDVYGVGLDSASADSSDKHGSNETYNPVAHTIFNSKNIYILENVGPRLSEIVGQGARLRLSIAPLPIVGGSGSPVRLVAFAHHDDCAHDWSVNSANFLNLPQRFALITAIIVSVLVNMVVARRRVLS